MADDSLIPKEIKEAQDWQQNGSIQKTEKEPDTLPIDITVNPSAQIQTPETTDSNLNPDLIKEREEVFKWLDEHPKLKVKLNPDGFFSYLAYIENGQEKPLDLLKTTKTELKMLYTVANLAFETGMGQQVNATDLEIDILKMDTPVPEIKESVQFPIKRDPNYDPLNNSWTELDLATREIEQEYSQAISSESKAQICAKSFRTVIWNRMSLMFTASESIKYQIKPELAVTEAKLKDIIEAICADSDALENILLTELKDDLSNPSTKKFIVKTNLKAIKIISKITANLLENIEDSQ